MGNTLSAYNVTEHEVDLGSRGRIKGHQYDQKARAYLGIPYARPPVGEYRWKKPQPLSADFSYSKGEASFDATKFGPISHQPNYTTAAKAAAHEQSEDCLLLNIWTPVESEEAKQWPVYLWLHGGWFQMGDPSHEPGMDPTELISSGELQAIVIAIGYRLNLFGFLSSRELLEESGGEAVGNYGLWDQRLAMEWVNDNIGAFGGDVNNVTLAGRSAGAYAVHAQALFDFQSEPSRGKTFHRMVMMSNAIPAQPKTVDETQEQFDELCQHFGMPAGLSGPQKLARLRTITAGNLTSAIMKLKHHTFRPVTDEIFIKSGIIKYHKDGSFAQEFKKRDLRLLIGEMLNEETLYAVTNGPEATKESLHLQVSNYYAPSTTDRVLEHYNLPTTNEKSEWTDVFGRIVSDGQVRAPTRFLVDSLLSNGVSIDDVWRYRISYRLSFITDKVAPASFGVAHAMDKPFWNYSILHGPTTKEKTLMTDWISDLVAFVHNDRTLKYGTLQKDDFKVATPTGEIEIQKDQRWQELLDLADIFAGV